VTDDEYDDEAEYRVTRKGFETIWAWMRLENQVHDMDCAPQDIGMGDDGCPMSHMVAFMLVMVIPTVETAIARGLFDDE
jgi:hypothetical protein